MKKVIKRIVAALMATLAVSAAVVSASDVTVKLKGELIEFDQPPVIEEGRTLVPLRKIFEALGANVEWNPDTRTVTAARGEKTIVLVIDSTEARAGDEVITLDVPARIINGRTLVPVRFIADSFGVRITWNDKERCVYLSEGLTDAGVGDFIPSMPMGDIAFDY